MRISDLPCGGCDNDFNFFRSLVVVPTDHGSIEILTGDKGSLLLLKNHNLEILPTNQTRQAFWVPFRHTVFEADELSLNVGRTPHVVSTGSISNAYVREESLV